MFLLHENTRTARFSNNAAPMLFASLRGRRTHTRIRSKAVGHPVLVCSGGANIHVPVHHPYTHTCTVGEQGGERTPDKNKTRKRTAKQQATPAGRERERDAYNTLLSLADGCSVGVISSGRYELFALVTHSTVRCWMVHVYVYVFVCARLKGCVTTSQHCTKPRCRCYAIFKRGHLHTPEPRTAQLQTEWLNRKKYTLEAQLQQQHHTCGAACEFWPRFDPTSNRQMIVKEGANAFNDLHGFKFQLVAGEKVCFFFLLFW